jgi:HicA toxin of bacterial toxin-antitoxin,
VSKLDRTFEAIFATPTRANIRWNDAVRLVVYYGGTVIASGGSAHKFTMPNGASAVIHRPHPGNQLSKGRVQAFRDLLIRAGLEPTTDEQVNEQEDGDGDGNL